MEFFDHLLQIIPIEMGVDFGGGNAFVAEHFLHSPKVGTAFQQMGGEAMPKRMWADCFL